MAVSRFDKYHANFWSFTMTFTQYISHRRRYLVLCKLTILLQHPSGRSGRTKRASREISI